MKPPFRQARNSPRKVFGRRQATTGTVALRATVAESASASAEIQSSNIRVAVRVRPPNERENLGNFRTVVKVASDKLLVFDPKEDNDDFFYHGVKQNNRDFTKKSNRDAHFAFDSVFGSESNNQQVFEGTTKAVVDAVLEGFNCSVFAYGATGAGKTHTMLGTVENPGITFLTVMELYRRMEDLRATKNFEISVSYLEVYNENVRDLLSQSSFLSIRDNGNDGIMVTGLSLVKPTGAEELLSLLKYGNSNRTQHPTDHNAESSRSHAVFQVWIKQSDRVSGLSTNVKVAKMSLIDLAGSERGCATGHTGERFREGNNINRSLLALGNCINALAEGRKHVPYRDSKLTRLLQDSLGGNCKTVMIAAISPSSASYEDTYNTLKYADRAKNIKSMVKKNERSVQLHVTQYEKMIADLRTALAAANDKIRVLEASPTTQETSNDLKVPEAPVTIVTPCPKCSGEEKDDSEQTPTEDAVIVKLFPQLQKQRDEWFGVFHERREIQHKLAKLEHLEKEFQHNIQLKKQRVDRAEQLSLSNIKVDKLRSKLEREIMAQKPKLEALKLKKEELEKRLALNVVKEAKLKSTLGDINVVHNNEVFQQIVNDGFRMKQLEVAIQESKDHASYLKRCLQVQMEESARTETIVVQLMKAVKSYHLTLRAQSLLAPYMEEDYHNLVSLAEGGRGVCWADQVEESREDLEVPANEHVILSPLTESEVRLDVPPSSVLCQSVSRDQSMAPQSKLDSTVVIHPVDLNATYDMGALVPEPTNKVPHSPGEAILLPLSDLPANVPLGGCQSYTLSSPNPANKENILEVKASHNSSIPIRTPSKDFKSILKPGTPKLRKGNVFSKSSSDLLSGTPKSQKNNKHNYMAATASSKLRVNGQDNRLLEPPPIPSNIGSATRSVTNPFKKMKKSVSTITLPTQRR